MATPSSTKRRPYASEVRAVGAAETREKIIDAFEALFWERDIEDVTLDVVAERAGVTVQTVLRKFGSKDGLLDVALGERAERLMASRRPATTTAKAAVSALIDSYEAMGEANWRLLREEHRSPVAARVLARARELHREWVEACFADALPSGRREREAMIDGLSTALDFYVWKLQRRDLGRSKAATRESMLGLVHAVLGGERS